MFDTLIQYYNDYFTDEKNNGFDLLCSTVCVMVLSELYERFVFNKEVPPIETLVIEQKKKYWEAAGKYWDDKDKRVKATKAAYTLALITSTV